MFIFVKHSFYLLQSVPLWLWRKEIDKQKCQETKSGLKPIHAVIGECGCHEFECVDDNARHCPIKKIQPQTIDLSTRLCGINTEFVGFIPQSLALRSIVWDWILIYRNWSNSQGYKATHWATCSQGKYFRLDSLAMELVSMRGRKRGRTEHRMDSQ